MLTVASSFLIGFGLQYGVTYLLRRNGELCIDRDGSRQLNRSIGFLIAALALHSCKGELDKAHEKAYLEAYQAAFSEGKSGGRERGLDVGRTQGQHEGVEDAMTGRAWVLYRPMGVWAMLLGVAGGVAAQISALFYARKTDRLPSPLAVALIPAMKRSEYYAYLKRKDEARQFKEEELEKARIKSDIVTSKIEARKNAELKRIRAVSTVKGLALERIPEVFSRELDELIDAKYVLVSCNNGSCRKKLKVKIKLSERREETRRCRCPSCKQIVRFKLKNL
ncbi:MAG: hypothetical protein DWQ01_10190 [Planctomycetota bacterium]|nr:MAG: hypothetical protein DWQ01_10190 [Planctomycetota bacterium]